MDNRTLTHPKFSQRNTTRRQLSGPEQDRKPEEKDVL